MINKDKLIKKNFKNTICYLGCVYLILFFSFCHKSNTNKKSNVSDTMDGIITRIYTEGVEEKINKSTQNEILEYLTDEEKNTLANAYWTFEISSESDVFVCRDKSQTETPYWLERNGFEKTSYQVKNEFVKYEVWHKRFKKGPVNLGINGFDRHRFVYFTLVKPVEEAKSLKIQAVFPENQNVSELNKGTFTYHDWDELLITEFSEELSGAQLLSTIRGRSREAHLIDAFRKTNSPSSKQIDQILQTWTDDPSSSITIGWRTEVATENSTLKYWEVNKTDTMIAEAASEIFEDRQLANDRYNQRFTATLKDLDKGKTYEYLIETPEDRSDIYSFTTGAREDPFEFGWYGDVHIDSLWGENLRKKDKQFENIKFYLFSGDLVNTGLYRNEWDELFNLMGSVFYHKPFMAAPGNHDSQEGLPPTRYLENLKYLDNGPDAIENGLTYHFSYGNAKFLMLDGVTYSVEEQKEWLEEVLKDSKETFKIAVFHFPPYTPNEDYDDIIEYWVPLFEQYGVDLVLNGHFHYYLRNKAGNAPLAEKNTPTYIMSVGTTHKNEDGPMPDDPKVHYYKSHLFQRFSVSETKLEMTAYDFDGEVIDQYVIDKN